MKPLTKTQAKLLAKAWAGRLLEQLDEMGDSKEEVISAEDYELVDECVKEIGEKLMGGYPVDGSRLDEIAQNLFPERK